MIVVMSHYDKKLSSSFCKPLAILFACTFLLLQRDRWVVHFCFLTRFLRAGLCQAYGYFFHLRSSFVLYRHCFHESSVLRSSILLTSPCHLVACIYGGADFYGGCTAQMFCSPACKAILLTLDVLSVFDPRLVICANFNGSLLFDWWSYELVLVTEKFLVYLRLVSHLSVLLGKSLIAYAFCVGGSCLTIITSACDR